jgi:protein TonB
MTGLFHRSSLVLLTSLVALAPAPVKVEQLQFREPVPEQVVDPLISPLVHSGGTVALRVTVAADGKVADVEVLRPYPALTEPVVAAVRQWRFRPATADGRPVEARTTVAVHVALIRSVVPQ